MTAPVIDTVDHLLASVISSSSNIRIAAFKLVSDAHWTAILQAESLELNFILLRNLDALAHQVIQHRLPAAFCAALAAHIPKNESPRI